MYFNETEGARPVVKEALALYLFLCFNQDPELKTHST